MPCSNVSIILVGTLQPIVSRSSLQPPLWDLHSLPYHNIGKQFLLTAVNQGQKSRMLPQSLSDFQLVNGFHRLLRSKLHLKWKAEPSIFERANTLGPLAFKILKQNRFWKTFLLKHQSCRTQNVVIIITEKDGISPLALPSCLEFILPTLTKNQRKWARWPQNGIERGGFLGPHWLFSRKLPGLLCWVGGRICGPLWEAVLTLLSRRATSWDCFFKKLLFGKGIVCDCVYGLAKGMGEGWWEVGLELP